MNARVLPSADGVALDSSKSNESQGLARKLSVVEGGGREGAAVALVPAMFPRCVSTPRSLSVDSDDVVSHSPPLRGYRHRRRAG